jgi:hypothetical protein
VSCEGRVTEAETCDMEPVCLVTVGCVHEHVGEYEACASHLDALRRGVAVCGPCMFAPDRSHFCTRSLLKEGALT